MMCFSDKRLLLFTAIVTDTIFIYKWTKHFRQKFINVSHEKIDIKLEIMIFFQKSNRNWSKLKKQHCDHTTKKYHGKRICLSRYCQEYRGYFPGACLYKCPAPNMVPYQPRLAKNDFVDQDQPITMHKTKLSTSLPVVLKTESCQHIPGCSKWCHAAWKTEWRRHRATWSDYTTLQGTLNTVITTYKFTTQSIYLRSTEWVKKVIPRVFCRFLRNGWVF